MKKDPLLIVLAVCVGIFSYFAAFKGEVHIWMIPILVLITALWYICTSVVTRNMIKKRRNGEEFFFVRASLVSNNETELINGALCATRSEIVFYKRKGYMGGIQPIWSCFVSNLESYSLEKIADRHSGVVFVIKGDDNKVKVASSSLKKKEKEFQSSIGW